MASRDNRRWKNITFINSLEFALSGIKTAYKEERNLRNHLLTTIAVIFAGLIFRISKFDWLFVLLSVFLVIAAELINSAIENVVDLASDYHFHLLAKKAKDMAAGAVLVLSGFAVIVGLFVFLPKIFELLLQLF
ncbi:diacylglycerol kinase family protein [Floricoccus penangensis]|uniref:UDP kinase n=1 Tax=Floricoccus penangensis TaxID=1859475 RepID=A0A9Q5JGH2_9LACT|nr:diacylglycerol kinase family protein [Floricoccus penangensis]OFI46698.1 UDP kinase [Floricoccus penangensis]URZ86751.1 diacylglycerol kinase family protein [Floricoccus penangensis]